MFSTCDVNHLVTLIIHVSCIYGKKIVLLLLPSQNNNDISKVNNRKLFSNPLYKTGGFRPIFRSKVSSIVVYNNRMYKFFESFLFCFNLKEYYLFLYTREGLGILTLLLRFSFVSEKFKFSIFLSASVTVWYKRT